MAAGVTTYEHIDTDAGRTLVVHGELDLATAKDLRWALRTVIEESHSSAFVDLSEVSFIDSGSVRALIEAHHLAPAHGSNLVIVSPSWVCARVFDILGLSEELDIRDRCPLD